LINPTYKDMTNDEKKELSSKATSFNENKTNSKPISIIDSSSLIEFIGEIKDSSRLFIGKCNCKTNRDIIKKEILIHRNDKMICTDSWYNFSFILKTYSKITKPIYLFNYIYNDDEYKSYQYILSLLNLKTESHLFLKQNNKLISIHK
jgi:hypothetical protein